MDIRGYGEVDWIPVDTGRFQAIFMDIFPASGPASGSGFPAWACTQKSSVGRSYPPG